MAARARAKSEYIEATDAPVRRERTNVRVAGEDSVAAPSPALILQQALSAEMAEPEVQKWPPAATVAFVVATCGAFWTLVGFGVMAALR